MDKVMVKRGELARCCRQILVAVDVPEPEAEIIADSLVEANLRGVDSHGVIRLPVYVKRIKMGLVKAKAEYEVLNDTPVTAVISGKHSMGQVLGVKAMELAIEKARENNVGVVAVRDSHHYGSAAYYALKAAENGMIGISMSNTVPLMPAPGGASKAVGNNPLAFAVPAGKNPPLVLDMALSVVALGKLLVAKSAGKPIPEGWATDKHGVPTTDPEKALDGGFILPVGGHKGYGLALMVDILSGVLSGSAFGKGVKSMYSDNPVSIGHLMMAINIKAFMPLEMFTEKVDALVEEIKSGPKAPGVKEFFMPGEIEHRIKQERLAGGIPLDAKVAEELRELAVSLGISAAI